MTDQEDTTEMDGNTIYLSYKTNTKAEKAAIDLAENYRLQYENLFPARCPLLIAPRNEFGVAKVISTYIQPTLLPFDDFYYWDKTANFVKNYILIKCLDEPAELPREMWSPQKTIREQLGNCFEVSNVLVSLLIGAGYDAYCVHGYATREICNGDESYENPPTEEISETKATEPEKRSLKYQVREPKILESRYEQLMLKKAEKATAQIENKYIGIKNIAKEEEEKPAEDALYGRRFHCWVLLKSGKRSIPKDFFIDPFTGSELNIGNSQLLGIEAVWNNMNYWACIQDATQGLENINWDLKNQVYWEPLVAIGNYFVQEKDDDDEEAEVDLEPDIPHKLPVSWCAPISITKNEYEMKAPNGKKNKLYKRAMFEHFSAYVETDGLVCRKSFYSDLELSNQLKEKCDFENRQDCLKSSTICFSDRQVVQTFNPGRDDCLQTHHFHFDSENKAETDRILEFYDDSRPDGLVKLVETPETITEYFSGRSDKLYYREVVFGERPKKLMAATNKSEKSTRPVFELIEKFERNTDIEDADSDIKEQRFLHEHEKIFIVYHRKPNFITSSSRSFEKPDNADDKQWNVTFRSGLHSVFVASNGVDEKPLNNEKELPVYNELVRALKAESAGIKAVRNTQTFISEMLELRMQEKLQPVLLTSVHDTVRNEAAKQRREEIRSQMEHQEKRIKETQMDYLAPFLAQIGDPVTLTRAQALKLKEDCKHDLKLRLIEQANMIQRRFEEETGNLQVKQKDYQERQSTMTKEDEDLYRTWCAEAMFRIQILEMRLNRHKNYAPRIYSALETRLKDDRRLKVF